MSIISNKLNHSVIVHTTVNTTFVIAGNNSVSNVAIGGEILSGAVIDKVWYSSQTANGAYWTVSRGANLVATFDGTGVINFEELGASINLYPTANLTVNLVNSTNGFIMIELEKQLSTTSASDYFKS